MIDNESCSGAGIILFLDNRGVKQSKIIEFNDDIIYLVLEDYKGRYDFPKGAFDLGEDVNPLFCAKREAFEEISLENEIDYTIINLENPIINKEKDSKKHLVMYVAEMSINSYLQNKPKIIPNPHTGNLEHKNFFYIPYKEMFVQDTKSKNSKIPNYLKKYISKANKIVNNHLKF